MSFRVERTVRVVPILVSLVAIHWAASTFAQARVNDGRSEKIERALRTTICEVVSDPASFDGKDVELRADVLVGVETAVLYDKSCVSKDQYPARIHLINGGEKPKRRDDREYRRFLDLIHAYTEPEGKRHSIIPDKYTVTATFVGRFEASSPSRPDIRPGGQIELKSVRDVVARRFDASVLNP